MRIDQLMLFKLRRSCPDSGLNARSITRLYHTHSANSTSTGGKEHANCYLVLTRFLLLLVIAHESISFSTTFHR